MWCEERRKMLSILMKFDESLVNEKKKK